MAIDDVYALQLHYLYAGQQLMNTVHFRMKTAGDPDTTMFATLATDWKDTTATQQVAFVTYQRWIAQQVRGGTVSYTAKPCIRSGGRRLEGLFTGTLTGGATGEGLPPQSALVTTLYTGQSGRTRRGRFYLGGLAEDRQASGTYATGNLATYQTAWTAQVTQYGATGSDTNFELGVWSHTLASGCRPNPNPPYNMIQGPRDEVGAFWAVNSAVCRGIVYNQRRRTIGVGR